MPDVSAALAEIAAAQAHLDAATALLTVSPPIGGSILVPAGGNLQAAINDAQPGDTILLERGANYPGNFVLTNKDGAAYITIRTEGDALLPAAGTRITPAASPELARLGSTNNEPAIRTVPGAHHWRLQLLELGPNRDGVGDIIALGDGRESQTTLAQVPHDLILERLYIHGHAALGQKRGIALNSASTSIVCCYIADIKAKGQDSQAIMAWNGPGPFWIQSNYLEAAGENVMIGGADPGSAALVPADLTILDNHLSKPVAWRGQGWQVKNLFELKNAKRVRMAHNLLENVWADAQVGYALVLTVRNQDGTAPYSTIEDVAIEENTFRGMGGGVQILGRDDQGVSKVMRGVTLRGNSFDDINPATWGGTGRQVFISGGPVALMLEDNTFTGANLNTFLSFDDEAHPSVQLRIVGNRAMEGAYGIMISGGTPGIKSLEVAAPGYAWDSNTLIRAVPENHIQYPASTTVITP